MLLTVVILTYNEERHIARAINSVLDVADRILVVDSGSTDHTVELAQGLGAEVRYHPWKNYACQFNWALDALPEDTEWIMRLDADEVVTSELLRELRNELALFSTEVEGVYVSRRMTFMGRAILWGGVFPIRVLRLFRYGRGRCEVRWMDEHISVSGKCSQFRGEIVDDNLNSLTWWINKHNAYASREVVDLLNLEQRFMPMETVADLQGGQQVGVKRWLKENVYFWLPIGLRAFVYFFYRYFVRLGFLDGREGTAFHVLQGFWYRYLVDMKLHEVRSYMRREKCDAVTASREILGIELRDDI